MSTQIAAIVLGEIVLIGFVILVVAQRIRDREQARLRMQERLIERFATPAELQQFLESEGGRRLLESLAGRGQEHVAARATVVVQAALVLGALGAALVLIALGSALFGGLLGREGVAGVLVAAIIVLALAGGLFLAARVARRQAGAAPRVED